MRQTFLGNFPERNERTKKIELSIGDSSLKTEFFESNVKKYKRPSIQAVAYFKTGYAKAFKFNPWLRCLILSSECTRFHYMKKHLI